MNYTDLLESQQKYNISKNDLVSRNGFKNLLQKVVIAPAWKHHLFEPFCEKIEQIGEKTYNIYGSNFEFSFVEIDSIGAPATVEFVLTLGATKCNQLVFIGSAGSLDQNINIGDLVIPEYSINGVGACRYLSKNLSDDFGQKYYPSKMLSQKLFDCAKQVCPNKTIFNVPNFSVDTVFAQFAHIEHIISLGAKTIEMETSALFKCAEMANIQTSAIFCISDNSIEKKSLFSGRNEQERELRKSIRQNIIPQIVINLFKN